MFTRPVRTYIYALSGKPPLQEQEEKVVNNDAETEELACPDTTAIVPFETVNKGKVADAAPIVAARVESIKLLFRDRA